MWNLDHIEDFSGLAQRTLSFLRDELSSERCLFLYQEKEQEEMVVEAAHGIDPTTLWTTAEISQELLRSVRLEGKPIVLLDAGQDPRFGNRTSVVLSNLRSILCVPLKHPSRLVVGLLYADNRIKAGAFVEKHLEMAVAYGQALEKRLFDLRKQGADFGARAGSSPEAAPAQPAPSQAATRPVGEDSGRTPAPEIQQPVNDEPPSFSGGFAPPPPVTEDEDVLKKFQ